jgi:hypothetical protein
VKELRHAGETRLAVIAAEVGRDAAILRHCREAWGRWKREAAVSLIHHDVANAEVMLDRARHGLDGALELVRADRLTPDDVAKLIAAR